MIPLLVSLHINLLKKILTSHASGDPHVCTMSSIALLYSSASLCVRFFAYITRGLRHSVQSMVSSAHCAVVGHIRLVLFASVALF